MSNEVRLVMVLGSTEIGAFVAPPEIISFLRLDKYHRDAGTDVSFGEMMTRFSSCAKLPIHGSTTSTG